MATNAKIINFTEKLIEKYFEDIRPPAEIRDKLDFGFDYKENTLTIFEILPRWDNEKEKIHSPFAKAKFVKTKRQWTIYWKRETGKWERYEPNPEVNDLALFFEIVKKDEYGCFLS